MDYIDRALRNFILDTGICYYEDLGFPELKTLAIHALNDPENFDAYEVLVENLPKLLLKYNSDKLSAEDVLDKLINELRLEFSGRLHSMYNETAQTLMREGTLHKSKRGNAPTSEDMEDIQDGFL